MSSVILTNWTVYYADDAAAGAGMKQIKWTGTAGTTTVNALYTALMDLFDNASQNNYFDSIPIKAITPTLYEIGSSDAGDRQPWFIDPDSVKHLTEAGLNTSKWTRDVTTRTASHGIYKLTRSTSNIVAGDIGRTITTSGTATGWLLHVSGNYLWIRPTNETSTHDFSAVTSVTAGSNTDTITTRVTNESIWSNIYTLGTIRDDTELYVYQNFAPLTQWWTTGHLDILVLVKDFGTTIDSGILTVYARQYSKTYDHFAVTVPLGGRTPVPLATSNDANNTTGYRTFVGTSGSNSFTVGYYIYHGSTWATATTKGVLTAVSGYTLTYYLIGDVTSDFTTAAVKEYNPNTGSDTTATCTGATPTAAGPAASPSSTLTVSFGGSLHDLNNSYGDAPYSVTLDLQNTITVSQLYQRLKYLTRRGQITDIDTETSQSIIGQEYTAVGDYYLPYDTGSTDNPFTEGETITATGSFSCTLTSKHDQGSSEGFLIVGNVRGTIPVDNTTLTGTTSTHTALIDTNGGLDPVTAVAPFKSSPFGTFAGGKFFGARGVWLANVPAADANNYELIDSEGVRQVPPSSITVTVNGLVAGDQVAVFQSTGSGSNTINKLMFTIDATQPTGAGVTEIRVNETIPNDTPGKTSGGWIRLVHRDAGSYIESEDRIAFTAWDNDDQPSGYSVFHIASQVISSDSSDTAYVPYIDVTADDTSESVALIYVQPRDITVRVRKSGILPFMSPSQITNSNLTITAVRATDPNI